MQSFQPYYNVQYDRVDSAYLDCISVNIAALLQYSGVKDIRSPFACQWYFAFDGDKNLPELQRIPVEEIILQYTGYAIQTFKHNEGNAIHICQDLLNSGKPVLVLGDAYYMPWLPYYGQEHQEHSFIVDGMNKEENRVHIVDAYYNQTEWGEAVPCATYLTTDVFSRIVESLDDRNRGAFTIIDKVLDNSTVDVQKILKSNAEQILSHVHERDAIRHFSHFYAQEVNTLALLRQFVLGCWLAGRTRALHALWLSEAVVQQPSSLIDHVFVECFEQEVAVPWRRVSEFAYITLRRVQRGRIAPMTCFDMLEQVVYPNEVRLARRLLEYFS